MNDTENRCCVCLELDIQDNLHKITIIDYNNESLKIKLDSIVSEVEWSEDYSICQSCLDQLEIAYKFRRFCIMLDYRRKGALVPEVKNQIYVCYHCNEHFCDKVILSQHIQSHLQPTEKEKKKAKSKKPSNNTCPNCLKSYSTQKLLKAHFKRCLSHEKSQKLGKKKIFTCEICDLRLPQAKLIVEHCIKDHVMDSKTVKPFTCDEDECSMRFTSSANLIQHKKYHKGTRGHICSFCGKAYITKSDLTVHEYTHQNLRQYKCKMCNRAFNTNKNLWSHNLVVHTDRSLWKYTCDICHRRFPIKSGLEQHKRRHNGDKRFGCRVCDKSFVSRSELLKHMKYHSIEKPFKCNHCDKAYKERHLFEIHLTKSHGIGNAKRPVRAKKFACNSCPNTFSDRQKLGRHLQTHLGVKPYQCTQCDKKFSGKHYWKQHLKSVHKIEQENG